MSQTTQRPMNMRILATILLCSLALNAAEPLPDDAKAAWEQVQASVKAAPGPIQLQGRLPTKNELDAHRRAESAAALHCADLARAFVKRFPGHDQAGEARKLCRQRLEFAVRRGAHDRLPELEAVEKAILATSDLSPDQRFQMRAAAVERTAAVAQAKGEDILAAYETGVRQLQREFPGRPEIPRMLYAIAVRSTGAKARELAEEVRRTSTSPELKQAAWKLVARADRIGKPLRIQFTAVDGSEIDTAKLAGKVILLDFWATWSGPSIAELPRLTKLHEKYRDRGLEILGISTDHERNALHSFINHKKIPWPQCFDNAPETPSLREGLGVEQIPAMWLIDRQGRLRDTNARTDLEAAVVRLLEEQVEESPRPQAPKSK